MSDMNKLLKIALSDEPKLSVSTILFSINLCEQMGKSDSEILRILKETLNEKLVKYRSSLSEKQTTGDKNE
jgi:hypothetical protein